MNNNNLLYLFFSIVLGYLFVNIYFTNSNDVLIVDNNEIFLYSALVAFLIFSYQKSIRLCGIMLIIIIYYIYKKNLILTNVV